MKSFVPLLFTLLALATQLVGGQDEGTSAVRFTTLEVVLDSGATPLAAWQVELVDPSGRARIVGIEGGEHAAFREPARYDPKALAGDRIILAAFSLDDEVPVGATRVATLHLEVRGTDPVSFTSEVRAAADREGREITPRLELVPAPSSDDDR